MSRSAVDDRAGFLRVEVRHQLGRALDVGEQRRDRLALAVQRVAGGPLQRERERHPLLPPRTACRRLAQPHRR